MTHSESLEHEERMRLIIMQQEYYRFAMLKPKIYKDGNKWYVLYGDNIQEGICGFGDNPNEAILDWNNNFYKN